MAIDNCKREFLDLAQQVLPAYMECMREAMKRPWPMVLFCEAGVGIKTLLTKVGRSAPFVGCYVLMESGSPIYVGISRNVVSRIQQHVKGKTHFDASLAYLMASKQVSHGKERKQAMEDAAFRAAFEKAKERLKRMSVAFIDIQNPLELHLFEAYCAMALDTSEWNTFRTH